MKKIIKVFIGIIFTLIIASILFMVGNILTTKYSYTQWVNSYLNDKYTEKMDINKIYFSDIGYCAEVYTEENPNLNFTVRSKYIDTYLESILEYSAIKEIESLYINSECRAYMFPTDSINTPYSELYELYKQLERPAQWHEVPEHVVLYQIFIKTPDLLSKDKAEQMIERISDCEFKSFEIYISDNNENRFEFIYNENNQTYTLK